MRRFFFAMILVVAWATVAAADSYEDAVSAYNRGDFALAERLFRPLAEQGDARAQYHLGVHYASGEGVPPDAKEALKWCRKAAEQGIALAQSGLGLIYMNGQGVQQDYIRAHMWFNVSAAAFSGDDGKAATGLRDRMASQMTAAQIEKAQEMARRCQETKFKECD